MATKQKLAKKNESNHKEYLSIDSYHNYITNGYINKTVSNKLFPKPLILIIINYIGCIARIIDCRPYLCSNDIIHNGTILKPVPYKQQNVSPFMHRSTKPSFNIFYGCSKGFKPNTGIHIWSIKINKLKNKGDQIGIVSNENVLKILPDSFISFEDIECIAYYLNIYDECMNWEIHCSDAVDQLFHVIKNNMRSIKTGDIISICMDSDKSTVHFELNGYKLCKPFNVDSNLIYYPAICSIKNYNEYEIVHRL